MVDTGIFLAFVRLRANDFKRLCSRVGQQLGPRWGACLIIDHLELFSLLRQFQHGFGKITAARGIDPTGSEDQMFTPTGHNQAFTLDLGAAVNAQRGRGISLDPRLLAAAIKHIIS